MLDLDALARFCRENQISYRRDLPMAEYTTFHVGGKADFAALPSSSEEMTLLMRELRRIGETPCLIGKGSNLLISDNGIRGVTVFTWGLSDIRVNGSTIVAGAGASLSAVCRTAEAESLSGMEFAYGIPGSVGGGVFMNAGAYGGELRDAVLWVECLDSDGELRRLAGTALQFGYRRSIFTSHPDWCILRAAFGLHWERRELIGEKMRELLTRRREKQPVDQYSAGSTFKRPEGAYAGTLIEQCGLRGFRIGDACVSEKHCGFIVNLGNASCKDIETLIAKVQQTVFEKTGYKLEPEVRKVGER